MKAALSIIIPALNEEKRIGQTLDTLAYFLRTDPYFKIMKVEVLVVAADPIDKTHDIVRSKIHAFDDLKLLEPGRPVGKGRDVQYGMLRAQGKVTMFMDADLATPLHHMQPFYESVQSGADIVIGVRDLKHYRTSRLRNQLAYTGNWIYQVLSGVHVTDTQCGFKMFAKTTGDELFGRLTVLGWDFDLELLSIAAVRGLRVQPLPIQDWQDQPHSTYKSNPMQYALRIGGSFLKISFCRLIGMYR